MRDRLIELLYDANEKFDETDCTDEEAVELLADHLLANGVIVPPCKVGDTVWFLNRYSSISMYKDFVYEAKVVRVYVERDNELCLSVRIKNEFGTTEYPRITEIGKTVFLTREEAERALKGGEQT